MKNIRIILWGVVAVSVLGFIFLGLPKKHENSNSHAVSIQPVAGFDRGSHFALTTQTGEEFNTQSDIPENGYALIFFGFTHCPVICPTELQKFAEVMDILPEDTASKISPLFITIDPERDSVDVMRGYVPLFHPSIVGLTGNVENVHAILNEWKVYFAKVDDPSMSSYTMDHSTYSYLVDHDMRILAMFRMNATAENIAEQIAEIAASNN